MVVIEPPLPPGCMTTLWGDDERFVKTYFSTFPRKLVYSTFDWGIRDKDGYYFILGRTDDVINVAGHRLGTREIEEAVQRACRTSPKCAVVGVADALKGQMPLAFAVLKDASKVGTPELRAALEEEVMETVDWQLGAIARPTAVHFVTLLPKTRSGKTAAPLDPGAGRRARSRATSPPSKTPARWSRSARQSSPSPSPLPPGEREPQRQRALSLLIKTLSLPVGESRREAADQSVE